MWSDLTLSPSSFKVKRGQPNLKVLITRLLLRGLQCETNLSDIMGWESFDVVTFNLGPLLRGQMTAKLKDAYNFRNLQPLCLLLLLLHVCYVWGITAGLQ